MDREKYIEYLEKRLAADEEYIAALSVIVYEDAPGSITDQEQRVNHARAEWESLKAIPI